MDRTRRPAIDRLRAHVPDGGAGSGRPDREPRLLLEGPGGVGIPCDEVEEGFLALDGEVDGSLRDAERRCHVRHLGVRVALLDEDAGRALHQLFETVLRGSPGHGCCYN